MLRLVTDLRPQGDGTMLLSWFVRDSEGVAHEANTYACLPYGAIESHGQPWRVADLLRSRLAFLQYERRRAEQASMGAAASLAEVDSLTAKIAAINAEEKDAQADTA